MSVFCRLIHDDKKKFYNIDPAWSTNSAEKPKGSLFQCYYGVSSDGKVGNYKKITVVINFAAQ
jgi:hypothetical protein